MARVPYATAEKTKDVDTSDINVAHETRRLYSLSAERGIFPPGLRWVNHSGIVFVRPPMKQLIEYAPTDKVSASTMSPNEKIYAEISFPWSIYCMEAHYYHNTLTFMTKVGFSNADPINKDDTIYEIALPNLMKVNWLRRSDTECPLPNVCEARSNYETLPGPGAPMIERAYEKTSSLWDSAWNNNAYRDDYHGDYLRKVGRQTWQALLRELDGKPTSETVRVLQLDDPHYTYKLKDITSYFFRQRSINVNEVKHKMQLHGLIEPRRVA